MIHFEIPKNQSSIIKVIGVGGGGGNAVNYMYNLGIDGVDFIVCNTDSQALAQSPIPNKIQLGPHLTQGLGAGANPEIGKQAGEESIDEISKILKVNTRMAFITAGMGGGTGTGAAPIIAKICRELGILTVGIVTTPFAYEGRKRLKQAQEGISLMKDHVDTILIISNDKLRQQYGNLPFTQAFAKADNVLSTAAKCITDLITVDGKVNLDFNDVQTVMKSGGRAILGSAQAAGEDRANVAVQEALNSPLLNDAEIEGAHWILLNITSASGDFEHTLDELEVIQAHVQEQAGNNCDIILGMGHDPNLEDRIAVTIIATGFHAKDINIEVPGSKKKTEKIIVDIQENDVEAKLENKETAPENKVENRFEPTLVQSAPKDPVVSNPTPQFPETKSSFNLELPKTIEAKKEEHEEKRETKEDGPQIELIIKNDQQFQDKPKIGERYLTEREIEEKNRFEAQKKALEERAERLRNMSFNIHGRENNNEIDSVPAFMRQNKDLKKTDHSSDSYLSGYSVGENKKDHNGPISSVNTFLDGKKPD